LQKPVEKTLIFSTEIWPWTTHIGSSFYILHHVVWCTSSYYNIMLNHHMSLQLPQEIVVPMMARKSECVSQTLCIPNKFTHEKKFSCTYPLVCQWGHSFLHPFLCWVLVIIHSLEHARDSKQNANTKQRDIPSLNIWSKMQIPNNGTFQAWTFEAKCKYQTTEHSKLEHLKQNANTKQWNIPSLNIWSKMQNTKQWPLSINGLNQRNLQSAASGT